VTREEIAATLIDWVSQTYGDMPCDEDDAFAFVDMLTDQGLAVDQ
jgi:hypothetical protein